MSVYTTAQPQIGQQPYLQQPFNQQTPWQTPFGQQPAPLMGYAQPQLGQIFGLQQPFAQQYGQQFGQQFGQPFAQQQLAQIVTELALRCAAVSVPAVVEQLRLDPQALVAIQAQGQIPPHVHSNVLVEAARRIAPVVHMALAQSAQGQMSGQFQGQPFGLPQTPQQIAQPWAQSAQGQQVGFSPLMGAGI